MSRLLRRRWLSLILMVSALVLLSGLLPAASSAQTGATAGGTIQNANTSAPLSGAYVTLDNAEGRPLEATTTTSNGAYSFSGLQPETDYYLYASDSGYEPMNDVQIAVGSTSAVATIDLSPALYSGTITDDASGDPLDQAQVLLFDAGGEVDETFTDADGYYAFPESDYVSGASYHVEETGDVGDGGSSYDAAYYSSTSATGSTTESGGTAETPSSANNGKSGLNIAATPTDGVITGKVTDANGAVSDAEVYVTDAGSGDQYGYAFTSLSGTYVVSGLPSGSYDVEAVPPGDVSDVSTYYPAGSDAAAATPVTVTSPSETPQINLKLPAAATISGTITNGSGTGLSGVTIRIETASGATVASESTDGGSAAGTYFVGGLAPGTYYVDFDTGASDEANQANYLSQWYGASSGSANAQSETQATAVTVSAGGGATVNAALAVGGEVSGTISDAGSGDGLAAYVDLLPASAGPNAFGTTANDETGRYTIYGVQPGTYDDLIRADDGSYEHYDSATNSSDYFNDAYGFAGGSSLAPSLQSATPLTVTANAITTINAALPAGAEIQGTVSSGGQPLQDIAVTAYDAQGHPLGESLGDAVTAGDGTYEIEHLVAGAYKVGFAATAASETGEPANLAFQYYNGQPTLAAAATQTVSAGQDLTGINASLLPGGQISGTVTDAASGRALSGVSVELLDGSGDLLESTVSRADGSYLLTGVPAGSYYVEFSATGTADQTQFYGGTPVLAGASAVTVTAGQTTSGINAALVAATTPEPAVTSTVTSTVTVPAPTSPAAMVGRPAVSAVKLAGVATRRVTLSFRLTAGANAGRLTSVRVSLPKGFSFVAKALKRDLKVSAPDRFTLSQGRLAITLRSPQSAVSVSFKAGAISVTRSIATAARKQRLASARFTLLLTSSSGVRTTLTETVKKPA